MLTFQNLQTNGQIPSNSFVIVSGKVYLDIGTLIGETVADLTAAKVIEMALKLLISCNRAQDVYNATALVGQRLNSFPAPVSGSNQVIANANPPGYYSTMQASVIGLVPANIDSVVGVFQ